MRTDPAAIRFRPTAAQMSVIWPGLDFVVKAHVSRREKKRAQYAYPFSQYPPPCGFVLGIYIAPMMNQIMQERSLGLKVWVGIRFGTLTAHGWTQRERRSAFSKSS